MTTLAEIEYAGIPQMNASEKARGIALELADDHQDHRQDGDLVTDLEELYDRVWERVTDGVSDDEIDSLRTAIDYGVFEAAKRAYLREETYDGGDFEVDLYYLVSACHAAGIRTPYGV